MHSFGIALLPQTTTDARAALWELMLPYDLELEVPEYKRLLEPSKVTSLAKHHGVVDDPEILLNLLNKMGNTDFRIEDGRLFTMSTLNPIGKWDYFLIGGSYTGQVFHPVAATIARARNWDENICSNISLSSLLPADCVPTAIICPSGKWHERHEPGWTIVDREGINERAWTEWMPHARKVTSDYPDHFVIGLHIHC